MWQNYVKGPYNADSPMKFTFLENDQQGSRRSPRACSTT